MNLRPYAPSARAGGLLAISGQTGQIDGKFVPGGFAEQFRQALLNVKRVTEEAGYAVTDIFKVTVYLADIEKLDEGNRLYMEFFGSHRPARSTVGASGLPRGALCEIEAWAWREPGTGVSDE